MILRPCCYGSQAFIEALANVPAKPDGMEQTLSVNRGQAPIGVQA